MIRGMGTVQYEGQLLPPCSPWKKIEGQLPLLLPQPWRGGSVCFQGFIISMIDVSFPYYKIALMRPSESLIERRREQIEGSNLGHSLLHYSWQNSFQLLIGVVNLKSRLQNQNFVTYERFFNEDNFPFIILHSFCMESFVALCITRYIESYHRYVYI